MPHFSTPAYAEDPPAAIGEALLYTDNTPGAKLHAEAYLAGWRYAQYNVTVVTDKDAFTAAIPSEEWKHVIAIEKYTSTEPSYADALRDYAEEDGVAHIQRWRDDPESPAASGSAVLAPMALQLWQNGKTSTAYAHCKDSGPASTSSGFTFAGFTGQDLYDIQVLPSGTVGPLTAGVYAAVAAAPPGTSCLETLMTATTAAAAQLAIDLAACYSAYGGKPNNIPPIPADHVKLADCTQGAAEDCLNAIKAANRRYKVCVDEAANN